MFAHILTLDRAFFQRRTAGEIMALATNDLSSVQLATGMGLVAFVDAAFMGVAAIAFMAYIDPWLTVIAVAPMPLLALMTRYLSARLHRRFRKVQEQFSALTEFARSTFSAMRLIKAYNQEKPQSERFDKHGPDVCSSQPQIVLCLRRPLSRLRIHRQRQSPVGPCLWRPDGDRGDHHPG